MNPARVFMSFNPLSTGHALIIRPVLIAFSNVSIPYLRVTHKLGLSKITNYTGVSIPYLRVTHQGTGSGARPAVPGFNPLSTGHAHGFRNVGDKYAN